MSSTSVTSNPEGTNLDHITSELDLDDIHGPNVEKERNPAPSDKAIENEKSKQANLHLIRVLTNFFKSSAVLLAVWFTGYFRFSSAWPLVALFVYVLNGEYKKRRDITRNFIRNAAKNEKEAVLATMRELPSWVYFPDIEKAEWLNNILKQMWPYIGEYVEQMLRKDVAPSVEGSLPGQLRPFRFEKIDLGDNAPRIGGVKVYTDNVKRNEIILDLDLMYYSDCDIQVSARGFKAGIKDLLIHGMVRLHICPLINNVPIVGGMSIFFLNPPEIDFDLTNMANMFDFPVLSNTLRGILTDQISNFMVLPNKIPIVLTDTADVSVIKYPVPQGILRIYMIAARDLIAADFSVVGKRTSDPYCIVNVGAQTFKTEIKKSTLAPTWDQYFEAVVDQKHGQFLEIDVMDHDQGPDKDDDLGSTSLAIHQVAEQGTVDTWLPLEGVKTGMLHLRVNWFYLSKDPNDLDKEKIAKQRRQSLYDGTGLLTMQSQSKEPTKQPMTVEDQLSSALLLIHLDSAKQLPFSGFSKNSQKARKTLTEPSPVVELRVGSQTRKSHVKANTCNPNWQENYQILVVNPLMQDLHIKVKDAKKEADIGDAVIPLKNIFGSEDMILHERFALKNSSNNADISLRLCLRILTSDKPPDWARDHHNYDANVSKNNNKGIVPAHKDSAPGRKGSAHEPNLTKGPESVTKLLDSIPMEVASLNNNNATAGRSGMPQTAPRVPTMGPNKEPEEVPLRQRKTSGSGQSTSSQASTPALGRIQVTIRYSPQRGKLILVIHRCTNLIACDRNNLSDPYVRIYLLPDKTDKRKTSVCKDTLNPIYDETFEWQMTLEEASSKTLEISVKNETSVFSKSRTMMGFVHVDLSQMNLAVPHTEWFDLQEEHEKSH